VDEEDPGFTVAAIGLVGDDETIREEELRLIEGCLLDLIQDMIRLSEECQEEDESDCRPVRQGLNG
jgi:hypothetical protein